MSYSIAIKKSAQKSLENIASPHRTKIIDKIRLLAANPRPSNCKKLRGRTAWRIRIGSYRVIYEIQDGQLLVVVIDIGHRKEIYR